LFSVDEARSSLKRGVYQRFPSRAPMSDKRRAQEI
jgi:hypothetical protein